MKQPNGGPKQRKILAPSAQKVQGKNLKAELQLKILQSYLVGANAEAETQFTHADGAVTLSWWCRFRKCRRCWSTRS
jgi:hypothetical protein